MQNKHIEYILTPHLIGEIVGDLPIKDVLNFQLSCKYISKYINFYRDYNLKIRLDWTLISRKKMTFGFMNHFREWLDWGEIVRYGEIKNIIQFPNYIGIEFLRERHHISEYYIEQYIKTHYVGRNDWYIISSERELSEQFVEKYMDKLVLYKVLSPCRCNNCREDGYKNLYSERLLNLILIKTENFCLFDVIVKNGQKISQKFILEQITKINSRKKLDMINLRTLFMNKYVPDVIEYLVRKNVKLPWDYICKYHLLPAHLIEKYEWYIDWDELSKSKLAASLVLKYQDYLNLTDVFDNNYYDEKDIEILENLIQENNLWWKIKDLPKKFEEKYLIYIKPSKYLPKKLTSRTFPDFRAFEELTQEEIVNIVKSHKNPRIFIIILFLSRKVSVETIMALTPYLHDRKYFKICVNATLRPDKIVSQMDQNGFVQKQRLLLNANINGIFERLVQIYENFYNIIKHINVAKTLPNGFKNACIKKLEDLEKIENIHFDGIKELILGLED